MLYINRSMRLVENQLSIREAPHAATTRIARSDAAVLQCTGARQRLGREQEAWLFATNLIVDPSQASAITSRTSTPVSVTPGGVGLLRAILAAFSASDWVLKTTNDRPLLASCAAAQYPLTKPGALLT